VEGELGRSRRWRHGRWLLLPLLGSLLGQGPAPSVSLTNDVDLARLIDLCADQLKVAVEYDPKVLQGAKVTVRLAGALEHERLWDLTNQLLAGNGLTTIQPPGGDDAILRVVKLADAPAAARVDRRPLTSIKAGYATIVVNVAHADPAAMVKALQPLLSKVGGQVAQLGAEPRLLVSDIKPRLEVILATVADIDVPAGEVTTEVIEARFRSASQIAALVTAAVTARNALAASPLAGKLAPSPDNDAVFLVAPASELANWRELVAIFDTPAAVETRTIAPSAFGIDEVAQLIEQTARDPGPRGAGDKWRVVIDRLTGSLIVTATAAEFDRIDTLLARLASVPPEARRSFRAIKIRNRPIGEIVELLSGMIGTGVFEAGTFQPTLDVNRAEPQRSPRTPQGPTATAPAPASTTSGSALPSPRAPHPRSGTAASVTLTADEGTSTIVAVGDPREVDRIEELVRALDVRQPQVMLEVLVLSLSDSDTFDLGVELQKIEVSGSTIISLASLFGLGLPDLMSAPGSGGSADAGTGFSGLVLDPGDFSVLIRALETLNEGRSLNVPKVLVNNNQQATLDAVLQQPFTTVNASDTVATTSFGGFENAGTSVTVTPQIAEGDHLILEYAVSLSTFVGESSDPAIPPPRQQNTLQSVVTIPDGYTVAVGGLEVEQEADATSQVPLLGSIPLLGEAFKSRSRSGSKTRFYVFIRANVMRHGGFEDLEYLSEHLTRELGVDDGWPQVKPRVIR
jgi:type II secretory pathway component GspD/PulD (secretin)